MYEKVEMADEAVHALIHGYFRKMISQGASGADVLRNTVSLIEGVDGMLEEVMRDEESRNKFMLLKSILEAIDNGTIEEVDE